MSKEDNSKKKNAKSARKAKVEESEMTRDSLDLVAHETSAISDLIEFAKKEGRFDVAPTKAGAVTNRSLKSLQGQTQMQLDVIYEQMKSLAQEVTTIKQRVQISQLLAETDISFDPVVGGTYYFYEKSDSIYTLSLISPKEWGVSCPYLGFIAEVKYMRDKTWKVISED